MTAKQVRYLRGLGLGLVALGTVALPFTVLLRAKWLGVADAINASVAIATLFGVLTALFQDWLKAFLHPLSAELSVIREGGLYEPIGDFVWHLKVKNTSAPACPLENCTLALTGIARNGQDWEDIPVERTLRWAPAESRDLAVSVFSQRVADFGRINSNTRAPEPDEFNDRFFLTFYRYFNQEKIRYESQGGALPSWVLANETVRFRIELRAKGFFSSYAVVVFWDGIRGSESTMSNHFKIRVERIRSR